jgi:hypothetical protein
VNFQVSSGADNSVHQTFDAISVKTNDNFHCVKMSVSQLSLYLLFFFLLDKKNLLTSSSGVDTSSTSQLSNGSISANKREKKSSSTYNFESYKFAIKFVVN